MKEIRPAPETVMGADVAASPHCPVTTARHLSAQASYREASRAIWARTGSSPFPSGVLGSALRPLPRCPRWLPDQGRSPGGSPTGGLTGLASLFLLPRAVDGVILRLQGWQDPRPKPRYSPPGKPGSRPKPAASQLPDLVSPVLPDDPARPVRRWPETNPRGFGSSRADQGFASAVCLSVFIRTGGSDRPVGAVRNLPLSHPLKGKPAASAWRRLRQPPCLHIAGPCRVGQRIDRFGCGWEGYLSVAGKIVLATD